MTIQTPIHAAEGNALALPPDIHDLCEGRNSAIALWLELRDHYHTQTALAASLCIGGNLSLSAGYDRGYDSCGKLTEKFLKTGEARRFDRETGRDVITDAREDFERYATQEIDRRCWSGLLEKLGFDALLDAQAREEFRKSLDADPQPFTVANVRATFGHIWGNRREFYLRGIANVFMKMDRRFRSHDAFEIGNRLIIEMAFQPGWSHWHSYERRDTLHDVERIFRELDGKGPLGLDNSETIAWQVQKAMGRAPDEVENEYFRVKVYKNGNLHLWFTRKDLLKQINALLLEYYKPVEGDVAEGGPSYESAPLFHNTPAKHYGEFFSSEAVAEAVLSRAHLEPGLSVLEPSAGGGMLAKAARDRGCKVVCVELQPGLAYGLSRAGFETTEQDFLKIDPARFPKFDRILMNPPFDRGRDCDHVRHAWEFLKPGGTLVAVMSARAEHATDARHKALHDLIARTDGRCGWVWRDLPEKSFAHAGTNVNTVTLALRKPLR